MAIVFFEPSDNKIKKVTSIHYQPHLLSNDDKLAGLEVDISIIPEPEYGTGKQERLYYDENTNKFFYEYVDRPLTSEEKLEEANNKIAIMQAAIDDLILAGSGF